MEKKISVKNLYLLLVISIGLIGLGLGSTYAIHDSNVVDHTYAKVDG